MSNNVKKTIMEESEHGEMYDLQNKVDEHIMEGSKHGEMDDLQTNKYISMDTYIINIYYYRITRKYMNEMLM